MKVLLLSDIHGNSDALEAVLAESDAQVCKETWSLGDLGGYGPDADRCFQILIERKSLLLAGNHDLYYGGRLDRDLFSPEALKALLVSGQNIGTKFRNTMKELSTSSRRKGYDLVHGSLINPDSDYILTESDAFKNFRVLKTKAALFGHTHRQGSFLYDEGKVSWIAPAEGEILSFRGKKALINPGSVGQPRDGDPRAAWAVLDTRRKEVIFHRTAYDISSYQKKMRDIGASDFLISRVETGI